jgi:hypothetical protein
MAQPCLPSCTLKHPSHARSAYRDIMHLDLISLKGISHPVQLYLITPAVYVDPKLQDVFTPKVSSVPGGRSRDLITADSANQIRSFGKGRWGNEGVRSITLCRVKAQRFLYHSDLDRPWHNHNAPHLSSLQRPMMESREDLISPTVCRDPGLFLPHIPKFTRNLFLDTSQKKLFVLANTIKIFIFFRI